MFFDNKDGCCRTYVVMATISIQMAFFIAFKQIVESESDSMFKAFEHEFNKLARGTISLPIDIQGTQYHRGRQVPYDTKFHDKCCDEICTRVMSFLNVMVNDHSRLI